MSSDDWKTQEIRDAEAALEEAMRHADEIVAKADRLNASIPDSKLSQEQIEQIEQLVRSGKAPEEVRALQERIDAGELSWEDIAEGRALTDEGVQQMFSASVGTLRKAKEMIDEGHDVDAIIAADSNNTSTGDYYDDEPPDSFLR